MPFITPDTWVPVGLKSVEDAALKAIKDDTHSCVTAGPGSGKTELLAQKAAFLFDTGKCPPPYRILAISFKRDSASNLFERVRSRCTSDDANRFDSLTFDGFTKNTVDRFRTAIPEYLRPSRDYEILNGPEPYYKDQFLPWLRASRPHWSEVLSKLSFKEFDQQILGLFSIPEEKPETVANDPNIGIPLNWLAKTIVFDSPSKLSFTTLNRLTRLILKVSPPIRRGIAATYPFIFVDEFQDTTLAQYDLLSNLFLTSNSAVTAVGDNKQRIMRWAGAHPRALQQFESDFHATPYMLAWNHRSTAALVKMQHHIATYLDEDAPPVESRSSTADKDRPVQLWTFNQRSTECRLVANWVMSGIDLGHQPKDFAILVKQRADEFESELAPEFAARNIPVVNQARKYGALALQDFVNDELIQFRIAVLRLAAGTGDGADWSTAHDTVMRVYGVRPDIDDQRYMEIDRRLVQLVSSVRQFTTSTPISTEAIADLTAILGGIIEDDKWLCTPGAYGRECDIRISEDAFENRLKHLCFHSSDWISAVAEFSGGNSVRLMTNHKSKGLEFPNVVLFALDGATWWTLKQNVDEAAATFFVGLTRAESKVLVTRCKQRGSLEESAELIELLNAAGVPERNFD